MKIKVYHQKGRVKITKIMSQKELVLFSDLADGEMAEIDIDVSQCTNAKKRKVDNSSEVDIRTMYPENLTLPNVIKGHPFEHAIKTLQLARDTLYLKTDETARAIAVLMDKWDEYQLIDKRSDIKELSPEDLFVNAIRILELESQAGIYLSSEEANQAIQKLKDVIKERMNKKYGKGIV